MLCRLVRIECLWLRNIERDLRAVSEIEIPIEWQRREKERIARSAVIEREDLVGKGREKGRNIKGLG